MKCRTVFLCISIFACLNVFAAEPTTNKPVLLYTRYFNAPGWNNYLQEGNFKELLAKLRTEFEVRTSSAPVTRASLADVDMLLIANPNDKADGTNPPPNHILDEDAKTISQFVERGGGLIILGNQQAHNVEINDVNKLLAQFGLQFTNLYTDIKLLAVPKDAPVVGGLRLGYYTGNLVLIQTNHLAKPRSLIDNDLNQPLLRGKRDQAGSLFAISEPGRGRVIVGTDCAWITDEALDGKAIDGIAIKDDDNWEIFRRFAHWVANH